MQNIILEFVKIPMKVARISKYLVQKIKKYWLVGTAAAADCTSKNQQRWRRRDIDCQLTPQAKDAGVEATLRAALAGGFFYALY